MPPRTTFRRISSQMIKRPSLLLAVLLLGGCTAVVQWAGVRLLYEEAPAPSRVLLDIPYRQDSPHQRHKLDLFVAEGDGWPVLIFVPGGGWTGGDKGLMVSGADVYGNIGRFYASRGIGTAVINYRLQPDVSWREQVDDVAQAVAWIRANVADYGGDPEALFLSGHSAGAQLAAYTALDARPLAKLEITPTTLCGIILVSGLAYDLADDETYRMGADRPYYEERFRDGDPGGDWLREASAVSHVSSAAPPFLLIHGSREWKALAHQNRLLDQVLRSAEVSSELRIAKQSHESMVLALTNEKKLPAQAALAFVRGSSCRRSSGR